ncbi:cyclin-dependent kinase 11B-like [Saccostrea echinata]|uniref:cyclin-dependent kinase 11B-like n=1 Tax=Saccostrea echinata TaxID=191078 RepID=UPI002A801B68|nr:cyclin-dependent kinase 11B-like [Saccostrea echinata]
MSDSEDDSRSPFEHGEIPPSPDMDVVENIQISFSVAAKERIGIDEEDDEDENEEVSQNEDGDGDEHMEEDDGINIKPPQNQAGRKEKSHKHRHKEDKRRDREHRAYDRHKDRSRDVKDSGRGREVKDVRAVGRSHEERGHHSEKPKSREVREVHREKERDREKERRVNVQKEIEKREKSQRERERLERIEREREREKRIREDRERREEERERKELERRKRREEEKYMAAQQRMEDVYRREKERKMGKQTHGHIEGRSRSRERHRQPERKEERSRPKKQRSPEPPRRPQTPSSPEPEPEHEEVEESPESPDQEHADQHESAGSDSGESASDSGSDSESSSGSESEDHEDKERSPEDKESMGKVKSKFDDHSDHESGTDTARNSEQEDEDVYMDETPPASPVELRPELPPYLPAIQGCRNVEEFSCLNRIEEGTYGVVYRAKDKKTDEIVALKRLKMEKEKEGFPITSLREINTLLKSQHMNIVTVREIVVGSNMDKIYIVMDYVEHDMKSLMETMKQPFLMGEVKTLMIQLLKGVAHLHDNWIIHRDLKTSNLLLSHKGILKIGDFGLAREYGSPLKHYTPVVVTLWYRAPELLLGIKEYSTPIDLWSVGCIFAEFLTMKPLWPGKSEIDELNRIFKDMGTPTEKIWSGVKELPGMKKCTFADHPYNTLRQRFGSYLTDLGFDLLNRFLTYDPTKRITAEDSLKHKFFSESPLPVDPSMFPTWPAKSEQPRKHTSSPKPPSGGKAYSKLLGGDDDKMIEMDAGFHLTNAAKGVSATGPGFSLKF